MTRNKELKSELKPVLLGPTVFFGDNSRGRVVGVGSVIKHKVALHDVSLVENLKHNLVSISQLGENGYKVVFVKNVCYAC